MKTEQDRERCYQVAKTINEQLFWSIDKWTYFSWGVSAKMITFWEEMPSLMMKVSGAVHKGWVVISLNEGADAYEVRLLNNKKEEKAKYEDIYCDQLGSFIDSLVERPSGISDQEYAKIAMADTEKKMALATW